MRPRNGGNAMNGMEKITARMKEDAARSLSELNAQTKLDNLLSLTISNLGATRLAQESRSCCE